MIRTGLSHRRQPALRVAVERRSANGRGPARRRAPRARPWCRAARRARSTQRAGRLGRITHARRPGIACVGSMRTPATVAVEQHGVVDDGLAARRSARLLGRQPEAAPVEDVRRSRRGSAAPGARRRCAPARGRPRPRTQARPRRRAGRSAAAGSAPAARSASVPTTISRAASQAGVDVGRGRRRRTTGRPASARGTPASAEAQHDDVCGGQRSSLQTAGDQVG